jgi:hypothetical protein
MPLSDFLTAGSAAKTDKAVMVAIAIRVFFNISYSFRFSLAHFLTLNHIQVPN